MSLSTSAVTWLLSGAYTQTIVRLYANNGAPIRKLNRQKFT